MKHICSLFVMYYLFVHIVVAQSSTGRLSGTVTDEKGNAVPGAAVTIIQTGQGTATTDKGIYQISKIVPGTYHVRVSAVGFKSLVIKTTIKTGQEVILPITVEIDVNNLNEVNINTRRYNPDNIIDFQRTPTPSVVITRKQIEQMGSRRLDEVLKEQTGLAIVSDIGAGSRAVGLQMQGFDSGYTMILIDGQPMTGRNSGSFDLSRITVANIERIEIIKGASSCLFGSEAMAGVVNIVTRQRISQSQGMAAIRYGSFNMLDANLAGETPFSSGKGSAYFAGNYYRTDGFNSNPYLTDGKTVPPYSSYTLQGRARYMFSQANALHVTGRFASRQSANNKSYSGAPSIDRLGEYDLNASAVLNSNLSNGLRLKSQYYLTRYATNQSVTDLTSNQNIARNNFNQYLHRAEVQAGKTWGSAFTLTSGIGTQYESMDDELNGGNRHQQNSFVYTQGDWKLTDEIGVIGGARLEHHSRYGSSVTPSGGISYQLTGNLLLKAAVSTGFKTPDFRQLYMTFTNFAGGGYTVIGAEKFGEELLRLIAAGQIASVLPAADRVGDLRPERSVAYNGGLTFTPGEKVRVEGNAFYNSVRNFIDAEPLAYQNNSQPVLSYYNIDRVTLSGLELSATWKAVRSLTVSAGYQLLYAKDKGVVDSIKNGTGLYAFVYDPQTGDRIRSKTSDYFGLINRSRHMANLRFAYENEPKGILASFRINYRGKYGFMESGNRNNFLDPYDTYVPGYFLFNASVQKTMLNKRMALQLTVDNLFNYSDMKMPAQAGRQMLVGLTYRFFKQ